MPRLSAIALLTLAILPGCDSAPQPEGSEQVFVVVDDFLTDPTKRQVELEVPESPVVARTVGPRATVRKARTMLPALTATPPARIQLEIPSDLPEDARLQLAAGFDSSAYGAPAAGAKVRFRVLFDGAERADASLAFGAEVPRAERRWMESEFPLKETRRVTLETTLEGAHDGKVEAAWGLLQIVVPQAVVRHPATSERPNLVLVVIDTLRADRLGCYGYAKPTSPRIDELAARGTRFARAYSSAPWTWPSTASILTSLEPPGHGLDSSESCFLAHELESLPEALQRAGLHTAGFSSNPLVSAAHNFQQGFDLFSEHGLVPAAEVMPEVLAWLRERARERFFLYLHIADPHGPYQPDPAIAGDLLEPPPAGDRPGLCRELFEQRARGEPIDEALLARLVAHNSSQYDGEVRVSDHAVGQLVDLIGELGLSDRTVFAVTSDHGEEFLEHGYAGHMKQLYDELVRVPLVLAGPGVPAGAVEETPVQNRFVPQTLVHLGRIEGARFPEANQLLDSASLRRFAEEPIFVSTSAGRWMDAGGGDMGEVGPIFGVRSGARAFDWAPRGDGPEDDCVRYFELESDPLMRRDLAPERPEAVAPFQRSIVDWLERAAAGSPGSLKGGRGTMEMLQELGYVDGE